jgi:hypothetical protein
MPDYQAYLTELNRREQYVARIGAMEARLSDFDMLDSSRKAPVTITMPASEPMAPIRPNRSLLTLMAAVLGVGLGVGLVVLLEFLDHSVKSPEHLSLGLGLPLFGVVPRIRGRPWSTAAGTSGPPGRPPRPRPTPIGTSGPA